MEGWGNGVVATDSPDGSGLACTTHVVERVEAICDRDRFGIYEVLRRGVRGHKDAEAG